MTKKPTERVEHGSGVSPRTVSKRKIERSKTANKRNPKLSKPAKEKKLSKSDMIKAKMEVRREKVRKLILEGKSSCAIARILGMHRKTIDSDIAALREEILGFVETNETFLTNMAAQHEDVLNELNTILKEECVTFKGGEEQPSAFLKIECLKTRLTSNKDFSELLFKLGKIKAAPEEHNVRYEIGWNDAGKQKKDKKKS